MPSIVGICPVCGEYVIAAREHAPKRYCSSVCRRKAALQRQREGLRIEKSPSVERIRKLRVHERVEMRARLAARDEAYAKVAPKTTVEIFNGRRIETRGNKIIGMRAAAFKWRA